MLCLLMAIQMFAQQSQSFHEYWFGKNKPENVQLSTKSLTKSAPAKAKMRSASTTGTNGIITLDLSQPTNPATFNVNASGVWTETYSNDYPYLEFNNSTFFLSHVIDYDGWGSSEGWGSWDGFTYSKNSDNTNYSEGGSNEWVAHQFGNMAGGGIKTDTEGNVLKDGNGVVIADPNVPYMVGYWGYFKLDWGLSENQTLHIGLNDVYQAVGIYVNNSPWPYYGNLSGDGFARPLNKTGDYFKLFIHGMDGNYEDNGKVVEHILAEYKNGSLQQSPNWEWVDLSSLGEIGGVYFTMESTDGDPMYGMNTAGYFCMDKFQVETIDLKNGTNIKNGVMETTFNVYPNPFTDYIMVNTSVAGTATIYNLSGTAILNANIQIGSNRIEVSAWPKGVYVLKVGEIAVRIVK